MKNKFTNKRLSYFSTPRIHVNVLAWEKPTLVSETERSKPGSENILRWEDDGGPVSENANPLWHMVETNNPRRLNAAEE